MPVTERIKIWINAEVLSAGDLNAEFDNLVNDLNSLFDSVTGHVHDGVDAPKVSFLDLLDKPFDRNAFVFPLVGLLSVGDDKTLRHRPFETVTIIEATATAKQGPTGADLVVDIEFWTGSAWQSIWATTPANRLKIVAGQTEGVQTIFDTTSIAKNALLRINVDQVGSTIAGSDVTVVLVYSITL